MSIDNFEEDTIINNFISYIKKKSNLNFTIDNSNNSVDLIIYNNNILSELSILELVIYDKIVNTMHNYICNIHQSDFILSLAIFFDGIPSISKVIEQRRRRIKNYLESTEKKILFKTYFNSLLLNNTNLLESLSNKNIINIDNSNINFESGFIFPSHLIQFVLLLQKVILPLERYDLKEYFSFFRPAVLFGL